MNPPTYDEWVFNIGYHRQVALPVNYRQTTIPVNNCVGVRVPVNSLFNIPSNNAVGVPVNKSVSFTNTSVEAPTKHSDGISTKNSVDQDQMKTSRTTWSTVEQEVLVHAWKDNYKELESVHNSVAWAKILSAVLTVGEKSLKQCKDKIKNLKERYKEAKDKNKKSGESLHTCAFFNLFDEILGTRDVIEMPLVKEVGASTKTIVTETPTRKQVENVLKSGRKRKPSRASEMKEFFQAEEERHEKFLRLMDKQMEEEKTEREKDRKMIEALFKMDNDRKK